MNSKPDRKLVEAFSTQILPYFYRLNIDYVEENDEKLTIFLNSLRYCDIDMIYFNCTVVNNRLKLSSYIDSICNCVKGVNKYFRVSHCVIGSEDLNNLVKSCSHLETLVLNSCTMDLDLLDFSTENKYKIKCISLQWSGHPLYGNWNGQTEQLEYIVAAIANSGLKNSLDCLAVHDCTLTIEQVRNVVDQYQDLENLEVTVDQYF